MRVERVSYRKIDGRARRYEQKRVLRTRESAGTASPENPNIGKSHSPKIKAFTGYFNRNSRRPGYFHASNIRICIFMPQSLTAALAELNGIKLKKVGDVYPWFDSFLSTRSTNAKKHREPHKHVDNIRRPPTFRGPVQHSWPKSTTCQP